ncbi:hypothetical protein [Campylobacter iguaniorum]|uniref:hypothetical protein n=1 Tax=Campylobacter iguaniorum TaxID=1244531 RepID=UPI0012E340AA|nr:hypothetical protein [Campylobacter iguaniorum]
MLSMYKVIIEVMVLMSMAIIEVIEIAASLTTIRLKGTQTHILASVAVIILGNMPNLGRKYLPKYQK